MKKSLKIVLMIAILILASMNVSMAASGTASASVKLTPSATEVLAGDTFTIVVSQECSDGIVCVDSNLEYDKNVFELTDLTFASGWSNYGEGNNITAMTDSDKTSGDVYTLTFKALANANPGKISLKGIKVYKDYADIVDVADQAVNITVTGGAEPAVTLTGISITNKPTTVIYTEGSIFDPAGMEITATYSDGTTKAVTNYTYSPSEALTTNDSIITISYVENGVTQTVTLPITVNAANTAAQQQQQQTTTTTTTAADTTTTNASTLPDTGNRTILIVVAVIGLVVIGLVSYKGYEKYKGI